MKNQTSYQQLLQSYIKKNPNKNFGLFQFGLINLYKPSSQTQLMQAIQDLEQAGKQYPQALTILGLAHINGDKVTKNIKKGIAYLEQAIAYGDLDAHVQLSHVYLHNKQVKSDFNRAISLLAQAADLNYPDALLHLGVIYLGTPFLKADYTKAYTLIQQACKYDHPEAFAFLGMMYENGFGIEKNENLAWKSYLKGAAKESNIAHFFLGKMYQEGTTIKQNISEAIHHYTMAHTAGHTEATHRLIDIYGNPAYSVFDNQKALSMLSTLMASNDYLSYYKMGKRFLLGDGVKKDIKQGLKLLRKSDSVEGYTLLGKIYIHGVIAKNNPALALSYFLKGVGFKSAECMYEAAKIIIQYDYDEPFIPLLLLSCELGNSDAMCLLARCYRFGVKIRRNQKKANDLIQKALLLGNPQAYLLLGLSHLKGVGENKSLLHAIEAFEKGAALGLVDCNFYLGAIFIQEKTHQNDDLAVYHLNIACNSGYAQACFLLGTFLQDRGDDQAIELIKKSARLGNKAAKSFLIKLKK